MRSIENCSNCFKWKTIAFGGWLAALAYAVLLILLAGCSPVSAEPLETWQAGLCFEDYDCSKSTVSFSPKYSHYWIDASSGALENRVFYALKHPEDYKGKSIKYYDLFKRGWGRPTQRGRMP